VRPPLDEYLRIRRVAIDNALERFLPAPPACPPIVSDAMRYSVFAGGKRFRPILTLASAETVAAHPDVAGGGEAADSEAVLAAALPAACAVEMIHTYSLIHDDLPAMDNDTMRRGRPTLHVVYGEGMAILGGDGLLTEAFALLAREPAGDSAALLTRKIRVIETIAAAGGVAGMVGGQALDLQATTGGATGGATAGGDLGMLERMHACKTGALIRATSVAGAIMAGGDHTVVAAIDRYATELGLAFQIVDDILDVEGASEDLGKTAGKDAAAGKLTFPALLGLDASRKRVRECAGRAHASLVDARLDNGYLGDIVDWVVCRTR
jgi:geranylgeranyl diphosphate synthase type II